MALTRFPIETTNPRIEVTLPVGRHVLELVVEDSAGLRSAQDQVIIEVRKEVVLPAITGILPVSGTRGATVEAVISGTNLTGASSVVFSGTGVTAAVGSGGTAEKLPVKIAIAADAVLGARSFRVVTPNGEAVSPAGATFSVAAIEPVPLPRPLPLEPRIIVEPIPVSTRPIIVEPTPVATTPITVEPIPTGVRPVVVDPAPVATRPIAVEPVAITPEVRAIVAEPRLVTPEVRPVVETRAITPDVVTPATPVIEARVVTPDIVRVPTTPTRVVTPGKAAAGAKKTAPAKKAPTTRKKK